MPEHVHLLLSEPERGDPSIAMQVLKQGFACKLLRELRAPNSSQEGPRWETAIAEGYIWQRRFYDFVVSTEHKRVEKLRYLDLNPVQRGLVLEPDQWRWSSYRDYARGPCGRVLVNEQKRAELKVRVAG